MYSTLEEFVKERSIIDDFSAPHIKSIMVFGGIDSGKTTLVEILARTLCGSFDVGIVDLDMGQSHIGPPTTVSWGKAGREFPGWENIREEDTYFTGVVSPEGNLLPCLAGAKIITDKALNRCEKVLIDTSGYISSPSAMVLKTYKLDLLSPDLVIGLEKDRELEDLLAPFTSHISPSIHRIPIPEEIRLKTVGMRSKYRRDRFNSYFKGGEVREVSLDNFTVRFTRYPPEFIHHGLEGRIVSFRDGRNRDLALGIIEKVTPERETLHVRTPLKDLEGLVTLMIGKAVSPL